MHFYFAVKWQVKKLLKGRVKNFDAQKGWGFIEVENEPDVFVHFNGIEGSGHRELKPGQLGRKLLMFDHWIIFRNEGRQWI